MATRGKRLAIAAAILLGVPVVAFVAVFNYRAYKASKTFVEYHVPKGYRGWVAIRYGVSSAAPLPFAADFIGGTYTVTIPSSGYLETSSPMYPGFHQERYYDGDRLVEGLDRTLEKTANGEGCEMFFMVNPGVPGDGEWHRTKPTGCE